MSASQGSRASWWGAAAIFLVAGFYAFALPLISDAASGDRLVAGERLVIAPGLTIVPEAGWALSSAAPTFVTLTKGGAVLGIVPPAPQENTRAVIGATIESLRADPDNDWRIGSVRQFSTEIGDAGLAIGAHAASLVQSNWVVVDDVSMVTAIGTSSEQVWLSVSDEMDAMVRSLVFDRSE